jgi:predicted metal-dependent hydrolase
MNHSSQFWKLLQEWVPDARMLDVKLSSQGKELMLLGRN